MTLEVRACLCVVDRCRSIRVDRRRRISPKVCSYEAEARLLRACSVVDVEPANDFDLLSLLSIGGDN